jgi:6-bladed beta-propeller protein
LNIWAISFTRLHSCFVAVAIVAVCLVPALTVCAAPGADAVISNGTDPANGVRPLELEELWRIGGFDDDENLLGVINEVLADAEGSIYLMDIQLNEVQVFSGQGEYERTLGKQGDGPGEVRRLGDILFLPTGNLGMIQVFPGRIVMVDLKGIPAGDFKLGSDNPSAGGMFALQSAAVSGERMVLGGRRMSRTPTGRTATSFIAHYDMNATQHEVYYESTSERDFSSGQVRKVDNFSPTTGAWTLDSAGRVIVAPLRGEYRLEVFLPDGSFAFAFTRPYKHWKRTGQELDRLQSSRRPFRGRNRPAPEYVVEPTEPDILQVRTNDDDRIWVLPSRGIREQGDGVHSTWDVFRPDGLFEEQVEIHCEGQGRRDALFFPGHGLVVLVKEHADAMDAFRGSGGDESSDESEADVLPLEVICYRILP